MSRLIALDTETTGLDPDTEDVFEIATVDIATGKEDVWHIRPRPEVVAAMHPKAVEVNRYHERVADPEWKWDDVEYALGELLVTLAGAHIVGAVPDFDTRHLTSLYKRFGHNPPRWHYHLIDVEALAVGYLHGMGRAGEPMPNIPLPWDSDDLSTLCGVRPPTEDRHTALADARWARDLYVAITS